MGASASSFHRFERNIFHRLKPTSSIGVLSVSPVRASFLGKRSRSRGVCVFLCSARGSFVAATDVARQRAFASFVLGLRLSRGVAAHRARRDTRADVGDARSDDRARRRRRRGRARDGDHRAASDPRPSSRCASSRLDRRRVSRVRRSPRRGPRVFRTLADLRRDLASRDRRGREHHAPAASLARPRPRRRARARGGGDRRAAPRVPTFRSARRSN